MGTKFGILSEIEQAKNALEQAYSSIDVDSMDKEGSVLYLLSGQDSSNRDFYAYMAIKPSLYREFVTKQSMNKPIIPTDYGVVLESGLGTLPSEEVQIRMQEEYGFNPDFEKNIQSQMTQLFTEGV